MSRRATPRAIVARRAPSRHGARGRRSARATRRDGDARAAWESLDAIHLLVFDLDDPEREAVYTTSRRTATRATNAFVCFESAEDALRAAMAVSERARADMPAVDAAPPAALRAARRRARGTTSSSSRAGERKFEAPATIVDEGAAVGGEDFAVSARGVGGVSERRREAARRRRSTRRASVRDARARAASAMRDALRAPAKRVRDAAASSASLPVAGGRAFMFGASGGAARRRARGARQSRARRARVTPSLVTRERGDARWASRDMPRRRRSRARGRAANAASIDDHDDLRLGRPCSARATATRARALPRERRGNDARDGLSRGAARRRAGADAGDARRRWGRREAAATRGADADAAVVEFYMPWCGALSTLRAGVRGGGDGDEGSRRGVRGGLHEGGSDV